MPVHIFRCSVRRNLYGFTPKQNASNLPAKSDIEGNWQHIQSIEITGDAPGLPGGGPKEILNGIHTDGYYFTETTGTFTESKLPG